MSVCTLDGNTMELGCMYKWNRGLEDKSTCSVCVKGDFQRTHAIDSIAGSYHGETDQSSQQTPSVDRKVVPLLLCPNNCVVSARAERLLD